MSTIWNSLDLTFLSILFMARFKSTVIVYIILYNICNSDSFIIFGDTCFQSHICQRFLRCLSCTNLGWICWLETYLSKVAQRLCFLINSNHEPIGTIKHIVSSHRPVKWIDIFGHSLLFHWNYLNKVSVSPITGCNGSVGNKLWVGQISFKLISKATSQHIQAYNNEKD